MSNLQYRLLKNGNNDIYNVLETVCKNRGISDYNTYLNLTDKVLYHYSLLDNIDKAVSCFIKHYNNKDRIAILGDTDNDGLCSSAMMYHYITDLTPRIFC